MPEIKIEEREEQYNTACAEVERAIAAVEEATEETTDLDERKLAVNVALSEAERCKVNLEDARRMSEARANFKPVLKRDTSAQIGMDRREIQDYRLLRGIEALARGDWNGAELEKEASDEVAKRTGRSPQGFWMPADVSSQRDLTAGTDAAGGYTVATELLADSFIELLRNRMVVKQAGATVLAGLVGDIAIPRQTAGATFYWVAESGAPTESQQTVDQVTMTPKTGGAFTDLSRKLIKQSAIDVENWVRADLAAVSALGIDLACLHGTGANNQPTGIAATTGIGSVVGGTNGAAPTWANMVSLETEIAADNADVGRMAYVSNAKVRGKLKSTAKVASSDSRMIWDENNNATPVNGYGCYISNQVSSTLTKGNQSASSAIFFGNWADLVIGQWGGLDILVDPYTGGTSGTVRVVVLQDVDVAVRHAESFAAMLDALTA